MISHLFLRNKKKLLPESLAFSCCLFSIWASTPAAWYSKPKWYVIGKAKRGRSLCFISLTSQSYAWMCRVKSYLGTTHHRYSGIWPKEHEVGTISTTTHCIISSTEASTNDYSNFGNLIHLLGKVQRLILLFHMFLLFFF